MRDDDRHGPLHPALRPLLRRRADEITDVDDRRRSLKATRSDLRAAIATLTDKRAELTRTRKTLRAKRADLTRTIATLTARRAELDRTIATLEQAVSASPFIAGESFSAADVQVGLQIGWGLEFGTIPDRPAFRAYWNRLKDRPALLRANALDDALARGSA